MSKKWTLFRFAYSCTWLIFNNIVVWHDYRYIKCNNQK